MVENKYGQSVRIKPETRELVDDLKKVFVVKSIDEVIKELIKRSGLKIDNVEIKDISAMTKEEKIQFLINKNNEQTLVIKEIQKDIDFIYKKLEDEEKLNNLEKEIKDIMHQLKERRI